MANGAKKTGTKPGLSKGIAKKNGPTSKPEKNVTKAAPKKPSPNNGTK